MNNNFMSNEHSDLCVGIDLGTTNSVLATINEKPNGDIVSKVVEIPRGVDMYNAMSGEAKLSKVRKPTLPSCVYYRQEKNYEPLVGDFAKVQYPLRPHLVAKSIKSQMGNVKASGLISDIPDDTPAKIASRILRHMLKEASKVYHCDINDAVITVPANFDSTMCKATLEAAELAGIKVRNEDGSERPVLLSEPNAVIYDLINQIHNGEISTRILDLDTKKRVLVFDLGGGTLDITIHEIKRREDNNAVLKVDEIATNRYTLLGGDDFDEEIAKAMFARYLKQFASYPDVVTKLRQEEKVIMPQLRVYAENLKIELNDRCGEDYSSGWDDEDEDIEITTGGNMGGIGYSYDDTFTKDEIEEILSCFMAKELCFNDYKRIESIRNTRNIIYPILDVLKKAADKLNTPDVTIDAVIVNGGMSKFYMVTERLSEFFGFDPIIALDPDQAVARGASVYHYYLHKYEEMQEDMKLLGEELGTVAINANDKENNNYNDNVISLSTKLAKTVGNKSMSSMNMAIQWSNTILNDSLYLGVKNGAVHEIVATGEELPYKSPIMTGFKIEAGQNKISIPIKVQNLDGSYRTIASGNISFNKKYTKDTYVAFMVYMGSNKVITMKAWTCEDKEGKKEIEAGFVDIATEDSKTISKSDKVKAKFVAPEGSALDAKAEIANLIQLCNNMDNPKSKHKQETAKKIRTSVNNMCLASNKKDFAQPILDAIYKNTSETILCRLYTVARKLGNEWTDDEKKALSNFCMSQLSSVLNGFEVSGNKINTNVQAIYALSMCGTPEQIERLSILRNNPKYKDACMYTNAKTYTGIYWILGEFENDADKTVKFGKSYVQVSAHALGVALRKTDGYRVLPLERETELVKKIDTLVKSKKLTVDELICVIIAMGCICDTRKTIPDAVNYSVMGSENIIAIGSGDSTSVTSDGINVDIICDILDTLRNVENYYPTLCTDSRHIKARDIAIKLINGDFLNYDEEQFLLTKLNA